MGKDKRALTFITSTLEARSGHRIMPYATALHLPQSTYPTLDHGGVRRAGLRSFIHYAIVPIERERFRWDSPQSLSVSGVLMAV
jgi:hypothetical protein